MESVMSNIKFWLCVTLLLTSTISQATSPNTDNPNLGFEAGTTANWNISNGTGASKSATGWSSEGSGVNTTTGITNYSPGGGKTWNVTPYGNHMMAIQAGGDSPNFDPAATAMGLNTTEISNIRSYLTGLGGNSSPTNASWARRAVTLQAGVTYTIAWQYMSTDYTPFNDGSMMTLVHSTDASRIPTLNNEQRRYALLGFTNPGTGNYATDSYGSTGWQLATIVVPVDGVYNLGFSSFNLGDTALSPILLVDDLQGTTTLNGQNFGPIAPNAGSSAPAAGSTAPTLCCGGSANAFSADSAFSSRVNAFAASNVDNKVVINQIGSNSFVTAVQIGRKNYIEINSTGSNQNIDIRQTTGSNPSASNYAEITINGGNNEVHTLQNSASGGSKGILVNVLNTSNGVAIEQKNSGNHYAEVTLSGGSKNVNVLQEGSANHMAKIELSGGATAIDITQSGSTQKSYSINHNCAQSSCAAISVTQSN
jgi:hypothetical protein